VPEDWKKANVTLIFQRGQKDDPGKYRSASLTLISGQMTGQIILEHIFKHMKDKKVIRSNQHGFMHINPLH